MPFLFIFQGALGCVTGVQHSGNFVLLLCPIVIPQIFYFDFQCQNLQWETKMNTLPLSSDPPEFQDDEDSFFFLFVWIDTSSHTAGSYGRTSFFLKTKWYLCITRLLATLQLSIVLKFSKLKLFNICHTRRSRSSLDLNQSLGILTDLENSITHAFPVLVKSFISKHFLYLS